MKVLLDENLPHQLRQHLLPHQAYTTAGMGWSGLKNGELLRVAEDIGFEVFVTGDLSIEYQQKLSGRSIGVISLSTQNWRIIRSHVEKIAAAVICAKAGTLIRVDCGRFVRRRPRPEGPLED